VPAPSNATPPASAAPLPSWPLHEGPRCHGFFRATSDATASSLVVASQRVRVVVTGGLAHTEVEAELGNDEARSVDARVSFLLPEAATPVLGDELELQGDEARFIQLLHVPAKQRQKVRLSYDQPLEQRGGRRIYRYAMSGAECALAPLAQFSVEVTLAGNPTSFGNLVAPQAQIVRAADHVTVKLERYSFVPNQDFTVEFDGRAPTAVDVQVAAAVGTATAQAPGYVSLGLALPASAGAAPSGQAKTRVFVLDKSYHQSPARLRLQAQIVEQVLKRVTARERIRLLACDSACSEWQQGAASAWLAALSPSGTFDLEGALAQARALLGQGARGQIVYLGSGQVSAGTLEKGALVESCARLLAPGAIDLRVFAVGRQNHRSVAFDLAAATNGTYAVVSDTLPVELTSDELLRSLRSRKLTNVRVELPSGLIEAVPQRWPALVLGQALRVAARFFFPTSGVVRVSGRLEGGYYAQTYPVTVNDATPQNPASERWWEQQRLSGRARVAQSAWPPETKPALLPRIKAPPSEVTSSDGPPREGGPDLRREVSVVADRFRRCYELLPFGPEGWFEGGLDFALQVDARGSLTSFAAEARSGQPPPSLFACLHRAAAMRIFEPPRLGPIELSFSQQVAIDWNRGLRAEVEIPDASIWRLGVIVPTISAGNDAWRAALAASVIGPVLAATTPVQMLEMAQKLVAGAPRSPQALDLLAAVAGAQQEGAILRAMLEAELALAPHDRELRLRAARAWLAAGDEQRACAHVRAASTASADLAALAATCRSRWLNDPAMRVSAAALSEGALAGVAPVASCQPFKVSVTCDAPESCPIPLVLTPQGQVVSPFGRIPGDGKASPLGFWPGGFGTFRVLLLGGKPRVRGSVDITVHHDTKRLQFERSGVAQNVATVELSAERPSWGTMGLPLCGPAP
jgi:hypothetical protein